MTTTLSILLSALAMSAIVALRYVATSGLFAAITARVRPGLYGGMRQQIAAEIRASLLAAIIYGVPAGIVAWGWRERGWTRIYADVADYPLWWLPLSLILTLFLHDSWFYWTHRWMHGPRGLRLGHGVHHASRPPTAWAAMRFSVGESLSGAFVIPLLVFVVPMHIAVVGLVLLIMTIMGVTNHMGWEIFPRAMVNGPLGRRVITASHHERHHREYRCNYGLYFRFWDQWCGTDREPVDWGHGRDRPVPDAAAGGERAAAIRQR